MQGGGPRDRHGPCGDLGYGAFVICLREGRCEFAQEIVGRIAGSGNVLLEFGGMLEREVVRW